MRERVRNAEEGSMAQSGAEYVLSFLVRGDNTVENAKKPEYGGALDAKELYPHLKVTMVEDVARLIYGKSA